MLPTKKLYLHIGAHKTATTSFQKFCASNLSLLRQHSIYYPLLKVSPNGIFQPNHSLPIRNAVDSEFMIHSKRGNLLFGDSIEEIRSFCLNQLDSELNKCNSNMLISGEDLSTMSASAQSTLIDKIQAKSFSISTYMVVRNTFSQHRSKICQNIKLGSGFSRSVSKVIKYSEIVDRLSVKFPDFNLVSYEEALSSPNGLLSYYINKFCDLSLMNEDSFLSTKNIRVNSGGCDQVVRLFGTLNELLGGKTKLMVNSEFYVRYTDMVRTCFKQIKGNPFQLCLSELSTSTRSSLLNESIQLSKYLNLDEPFQCLYPEERHPSCWTDDMKQELSSIVSKKTPEILDLVLKTIDNI